MCDDYVQIYHKDKKINKLIESDIMNEDQIKKIIEWVGKKTTVGGYSENTLELLTKECMESVPTLWIQQANEVEQSDKPSINNDVLLEGETKCSELVCDCKEPYFRQTPKGTRCFKCNGFKFKQT